MRFTTIVFLAVAGILLSPTDRATAYPTGAAKCTGFGGEGLGALEAMDFAVTIDGTELGPNGLEVPAGQDLMLSLASKGDTVFKGFLFRLSADKMDPTIVDVSGSLSNPSSSSDIQIMESTGESVGAFPNAGTCHEFVAGATHTAGDDNLAHEKTAVEAMLNVDSAVVGADMGARTLSLEVTAVTRRVNGTSPHEFYYSAFPLTVTSDSAAGDEEPATSTAPNLYASTKYVCAALLGGSALSFAAIMG